MAKPAKKRKRYKSPKAILRHTLAYFKANPDNWTTLTLRRQNKKADDGIQFCAIGGCLYFADNQKLGNVALRYLAKALGKQDAQTAALEDVKYYILSKNDGQDGRTRILNGLERATG